MRKDTHPRQTKQHLQLEEKSPMPWGYFILTIICAGVLAAGFFFAAQQHFMAMDLSFKNSDLRKQVDELEGEKRRLLLAREVVRSPGEIMRLARNQGMRTKNTERVIAASVKPSEKNTLVVKTSMMLPQLQKDEKKRVKAFLPTSPVKPLVIMQPAKIDAKVKKEISERSFAAKMR